MWGGMGEVIPGRVGKQDSGRIRDCDKGACNYVLNCKAGTSESEEFRQKTEFEEAP